MPPISTVSSKNNTVLQLQKFNNDMYSTCKFVPQNSRWLGSVVTRWSRVQLPATVLWSNNVCSHPCISVTKQCKLVQVNGQWCPTAGKVTVGLASHWPCVITDFSG